MTILGRIKEWINRGVSLTNDKAWNPSMWALAGSFSVTGEVVTEATALTYSAVFNAVSLISGTIGALPLHLMQRKGKKKSTAENQSLYQVMHDQANPYMTAMQFRECLMAHVLTWGNGYAEITRDGLGRIAALWPISPNRVRLQRVDQELVYVIRVDGVDVLLPRERVLHVAGLGFDGYQGYSVVAMARKSIGLGMAMETFGSLYFGNGTHPGTIVSHPGKLSTQGHDNLQRSLVDAHSGLGQSHKLLLLEEGMTVQKFGVPPNDSQFLESRQFQIPEIARWFNLPPHKLKDLTKSSFSNIESEQQSFYVDSILPWLVRLEQSYNAQLLTPGDRGLYGHGRLYFKHAVEGLLRGDSTARGDFYTKLFNIGVLSVNDIRALEDWDPVEGGDEHFVPLNMTTLKNAGKPPAPKELPAKGNGKANGEDEELEEPDGEEDGATDRPT